MALSVRRTGYHEWLKVELSGVRQERQSRNDELLTNLKNIKAKNKNYGTLRLRRGLLPNATDGKRPSYGKIYKLCKDNGLLQKTKKPKGITKADPKEQASEDLIKRDFTADTPNAKWLSDITEIQGKDGKLYVAGVLDCYDGVIVGLSMDNNMKTELCINAMNIALHRYLFPTKAKGEEINLISHSDRGSQYTSKIYRRLLDKHGIKQSMGRTGSCFDNARMESFFATIKKELIYEMDYQNMTREELKAAIFKWVELDYNRERFHSSNEDYLPPLEKRNNFFDTICSQKGSDELVA
jgi:transposase InsO family protein